MIQHLSSADYKCMLWKNGAGYTIELARSEGSSLELFDWRISMADVKTSGSFSKFECMQRYLTVLEGQDILLNIDHQVKHLQYLESIKFSGESQVSCELLNGKIRDFNLIYDAKKFHVDYEWMFESAASEIKSSADLIFVFNQSLEPLEIKINESIFYLEHQESLIIKDRDYLKSISFGKQDKKQVCAIRLTKI